MIPVALALALVQNEPVPTLEASARNFAGSFVCEGTTDLPDEARLRVSVGYINGDRTVTLAAETVLTREGKFRADLPVFAAAPLPGRYQVTVQFTALAQKRTIDRSSTHRVYPVDVPGDLVKAKREFFTELRSAMSEIDRLRKVLPGDWKETGFKRIRGLIDRPETHALGILTPLEDAGAELFDCLCAMTQAGQAERAPHHDQFDKVMRGFLERLDALLSDPRRSFELLEQIEAALNERKAADSMVLELGGHLGSAHQEALAALAARIAEGKTPEALESIRKLRRKLAPSEHP